ncbi:MAG: DNA recombination protein RmuC [Clostridia bacterium]|nr:DNA recombination protein RmuC [Clostridia bacterium]
MVDRISSFSPWLIPLCGVLLVILAALLIALLKRQKDLSVLLRSQSEQLMQKNAAQAETMEEHMRNELARQQQAYTAAWTESSRASAQHMEMLSTRLDVFDQSQDIRLHRITSTLDSKLSQSDQRAEQLKNALNAGMEKLQRENAEKLEQMRKTVDEKLHETLNKRLGESFSLVNERLEQVYKGLGEMQSLANGVGDLKKVLSNVKTRGIWGEVQLGALLSQIMAPSQYAENVQVIPHSPERVEYAIILPGAETDAQIYLPIDSKYPMEAYERLLEAAESGDSEAVGNASAALCSAIRTEAKRISSKYIEPPYTTDFAILFLATEGLYAEALRSRGLMEELQQKYRILIAGPSTLSALLNSLQVGFRTLAIEQRSAEVWQLLGAVKTEFGRFSDLLDQTQQRLRQAGETIEKAAVRTRAINRRLRDVEAIGTGQAQQLLPESQENEI